MSIFFILLAAGILLSWVEPFKVSFVEVIPYLKMFQHFHITILLLDKAIYIILKLEDSLEAI